MLKQLIQRLLDSRTTPSEAAHSAMPQENQVINYGSTTENPGSWTTILSFTAPKDGYAKAVVVGTGKNSAELYCGNVRVSAFAPVDNASINVVMPVRKGASVGLVSTVFRSAALYFVPSIGGGYNNFVWRALLCLRALSNCLQKVFSKARNRGLVCRDSRQLRRQSYPQQWTQHGELMSLQQTVMSFLVAAHRNVSCTTRWVPALIMGASHGCLEDLFRSGRAELCTITSKVRTAPQDSPLLHVNLFNLRTGGALC